MALININGNVEVFNDTNEDIVSLIRYYMGGDMAEHVEGVMKEQNQENEELLDTLKTAYKDLKLVIKRAENCNLEDTMGDIDDIYQNIEENLYYYNVTA